jgi:ribonuclease HI
MDSTLRKGKVPKTWKHQLIIPLLKPGKDPKQLSSFRPVSLTSVLCKVTERIISNRLASFLDKSLTDRQSGFRPGRRTADQLAHAFAFVERARAKAHTNKVAAVLVDFSRAFDKVDHRLLIDIMEKNGFPRYIILWIHDFLRHREGRVMVGSTKTAWNSFSCGVPQGTVLGPLLFLIYINELARALEAQGIDFGFFADDLTLFLDDTDTQLLSQRINAALEIINQWSKSHYMKVAPEKTKYMMFNANKTSRKNKAPLVDLDIVFDGEKVDRCDTPTLLGYRLGPDSNASEHVEYLVTEDRARLSQLRRLVGASWGPNSSTLRTFYTGYCLGKLGYAAEAWMHLPSASDFEKLEKQHRTAARMIAGLHLTASNISSLNEANLPSFKDITLIRSFKYMIHCFGSSGLRRSDAHAIFGTNHPARKLFEEVEARHGLTIATGAAPAAAAAAEAQPTLSENAAQQHPRIHVPLESSQESPYEDTHKIAVISRQVKIFTTLLTKISSKATPKEKFDATMETITKRIRYPKYRIFTDGCSKISEGKSGGAAIVQRRNDVPEPDGSYKYTTIADVKVPAGTLACSMTAESYALRAAVRLAIKVITEEERDNSSVKSSREMLYDPACDNLRLPPAGQELEMLIRSCKPREKPQETQSEPDDATASFEQHNICQHEVPVTKRLRKNAHKVARTICFGTTPIACKWREALGYHPQLECNPRLFSDSAHCPSREEREKTHLEQISPTSTVPPPVVINTSTLPEAPQERPKLRNRGRRAAQAPSRLARSEYDDLLPKTCTSATINKFALKFYNRRCKFGDGSITQYYRKSRPTVAFMSDSQSLLCALASGPFATTDPILGDIWHDLIPLGKIARVKLQHVRSHCGVEGNEIVDRLADEAAELCQSGVPAHPRDVNAAAKAILRKKHVATGSLPQESTNNHTKRFILLGEEKPQNLALTKHLSRLSERTLAQLRGGFHPLIGSLHRILNPGRPDECRWCCPHVHIEHLKQQKASAAEKAETPAIPLRTKRTARFHASNSCPDCWVVLKNRRALYNHMSGFNPRGVAKMTPTCKKRKARTEQEIRTLLGFKPTGTKADYTRFSAEYLEQVARNRTAAERDAEHVLSVLNDNGTIDYSKLIQSEIGRKRYSKIRDYFESCADELHQLQNVAIDDVRQNQRNAIAATANEINAAHQAKINAERNAEQQDKNNKRHNVPSVDQRNVKSQVPDATEVEDEPQEFFLDEPQQFLPQVDSFRPVRLGPFRAENRGRASTRRPQIELREAEKRYNQAVLNHKAALSNGSTEEEIQQVAKFAADKYYELQDDLLFADKRSREVPASPSTRTTTNQVEIDDKENNSNNNKNKQSNRNKYLDENDNSDSDSSNESIDDYVIQGKDDDFEEKDILNPSSLDGNNVDTTLLQLTQHIPPPRNNDNNNNNDDNNANNENEILLAIRISEAAAKMLEDNKNFPEVKSPADIPYQQLLLFIKLETLEVIINNLKKVSTAEFRSSPHNQLNIDDIPLSILFSHMKSEATIFTDRKKRAEHRIKQVKNRKNNNNISSSSSSSSSLNNNSLASLHHLFLEEMFYNDVIEETPDRMYDRPDWVQQAQQFMYHEISQLIVGHETVRITIRKNSRGNRSSNNNNNNNVILGPAIPTSSMFGLRILQNNNNQNVDDHGKTQINKFVTFTGDEASIHRVPAVINNQHPLLLLSHQQLNDSSPEQLQNSSNQTNNNININNNNTVNDFKFICPECKRTCKNAKGLAIHRGRSHKQKAQHNPSNNTNTNTTTTNTNSDNSNDVNNSIILTSSSTRSAKTTKPKIKYDDDSDLELLLAVRTSEDPNNNTMDPHMPNGITDHFQPHHRTSPEVWLFDDDDDVCLSSCQSKNNNNTSHNKNQNLENSSKSSTINNNKDDVKQQNFAAIVNNISDNSNTSNNKDGSQSTPEIQITRPATLPKETIDHVFLACPKIAQLRIKYKFDPNNLQRSIKVLLSSQSGFHFFTEVLKMLNIETKLREPEFLRLASLATLDGNTLHVENTCGTDLSNKNVNQPCIVDQQQNEYQNFATSGNGNHLRLEPPSLSNSSSSAGPNHTNQRTVVSSWNDGNRRNREEEEVCLDFGLDAERD